MEKTPAYRLSHCPVVYLLFSVCLCFASLAARGEGNAVHIAQELHKMLTSGSPLLHSDPLYAPVVSAVANGDLVGAAALITDPASGADAFYNNTVPDLAQSWNVTGTLVGSRNDLSAMFLGVARDRLPLTALLTDDIIYYDPTGTPAGVKYAIDDSGCSSNLTAAGTFCNDGHYQAVWSTTNPRTALQRGNHPVTPGVGIFYSWTWAMNYDSAGTARRNLLGIMNNIYLSQMDAFRTNGIPTDAIRQDVPRTDPSFATSCVQCHAKMDHDVDPFLVKNVTGNTFTGDTFADKLNVINGPNFPAKSPAFTFYFTSDQNQAFYDFDLSGLSAKQFSPTVSYVTGQNLSDYAKILAKSRGFCRGLVKRIVMQLYGRKLISVQNMTPDDFSLLNSQAASIEAFTAICYQNPDLVNLYNQVAAWYVVSK